MTPPACACDIASTIVQCLLPSLPPVAPQVRDALPREGLVEVLIVDHPALGVRVPLDLEHPPIGDVAPRARREASRVALRATALNEESIAPLTPVAPLPGLVVGSPRRVAMRVHLAHARTATAKGLNVRLAVTTATIVSSATNAARVPRALDALAPAPIAVTRVVPIVETRADPNVAHVATRVVPTLATMVLVLRVVKAIAVPTTVTRDRAVAPPVVVRHAVRVSRAEGVPSTPIALSARAVHCHRARVAIPARASVARRAN